MFESTTLKRKHNVKTKVQLENESITGRRKYNWQTILLVKVKSYMCVNNHGQINTMYFIFSSFTSFTWACLHLSMPMNNIVYIFSNTCRFKSWGIVYGITHAHTHAITHVLKHTDTCKHTGMHTQAHARTHALVHTHTSLLLRTLLHNKFNKLYSKAY